MSSTSTSTSSTHTTTTTSPPAYDITIRELVIAAIKTKVDEISLANGYRNDIANVGIGYRFWGKNDLNAISILPRTEDTNHQLGVRSNPMQVTILGFSAFNPSSENPSPVAEPLLADIKHNILGLTFRIPFVLGQNEPSQGDLLKGQTSGATVRVMRINHTTGSWALGNAGGTFRVRDMRGFLLHNENLLNASGAVVAKGQTIVVEDRFGGYVTTVDYVTGGIEGYPEVGETVIAVTATFSFTYMTMNDNPYLQP